VELEARRKELAPKTFSGDEKAKLELEGLEDEHDEISRTTRVAKAAVPEFEKMVGECEERLAQAERAVHKAHHERLRDELTEREQEAEELLATYFDKQLQIKELRSHVVIEGTKAGMRIYPDVFSVADKLFEKARAWELRL